MKTEVSFSSWRKLSCYYIIWLFCGLVLESGTNGTAHRTQTNNGTETFKRHRHHQSSSSQDKLSLWIPNEQVKMFSGFPMEIQAIVDGRVLPYILDPNFQDYLPVIPSEVNVVNFTWKAGDRKYFYHFDRLQSFNEDILLQPHVSIDVKGRIPRRPRSFSVILPCSGKKPGIASFGIGLLIETRRGRPLPGTPLRLRLRKECRDPILDSPRVTDFQKCQNNSRWNENEHKCICSDGYMGPQCASVLCYPVCLNGGICVSPGKCSCLTGFHGTNCESGICTNKCLNGGKCIQKDTCQCGNGYYGQTCQFSKCMIPCLNAGKCVGVNTCRCQVQFNGDHCEIGLSNRTLSQRHSCSLPCRNGNCVGPNKCQCHDGWYGKRCQRKKFLRRR